MVVSIVRFENQTSAHSGAKGDEVAVPVVGSPMPAVATEADTQLG